jgi:hypothetical protein
MISENFKIIRSQIPENVCLVAVSKTKPKELILEAYNLGQRHFGENKVQELSEKASELPKDIQWHLIGHLQTNKVKYIAEFVHLIHAVDSLKLLQEINKQALKHNRVIACLLQFHIADEETKFGLSREEAKLLLSSESYSALQNIKIIGVMGMASFVDDKNQIRNEFKALQAIFSEIKSDYFSDQTSFKEISMGMSGDFQLAIEEGSTMVRIGSSLFS